MKKRSDSRSSEMIYRVFGFSHVHGLLMHAMRRFRVGCGGFKFLRFGDYMLGIRIFFCVGCVFLFSAWDVGMLSTGCERFMRHIQRWVERQETLAYVSDCGLFE